VTGITGQLDLSFREDLHPRDAHGHWVKKAGPSPGERFVARHMRAQGAGPETIRSQLEVNRIERAKELLRQHQHENRRAAGGTWTVDEQGQIIRGAHAGIHGQGIFADLLKRASSPGHWVFIRSGNREVTEPRVGDMARMSLGAAGNQVGTVISVAGGHAAIDSGDDGMRYLVDWRNGGRVVQKIPLSQVGPALPAFAPPPPKTPSPSPPGVMVAPGVKQYLLPGMPVSSSVGHDSDPVRKLRKITVADLEKGKYRDISNGIQGIVGIVTLPGGVRVVHKVYLPGNEDMTDADELSYYVSQVVGAGAPAVARPVGGKTGEIIMDFVPGDVAGENKGGADAYDLEHDDPQGRQIGILDYLISNPDRHAFNWMITPGGKPVPIDMSGAFAGDRGTNSPFWHNERVDQAEYDELVEGLTAIKPEFDRMGHQDWYTQMMARLSDIAPAPGAGGQVWSTVSGQALELGWRYNPAEARDQRGRWTRGGKSYTVPDPARLNVKPNRSPVNYPHPQDHPFFKTHPVSPEHILAAYKASTDQEKAQGVRWYADAHNLAAKMADGDARKGAILLASYSSQVSWPVNMFNAARAAEENRALGPGDGMISRDMQANAQEALDGATVDEALQAPKTRAFAHLIEHGGDAPDDTEGQVAVDRHALSVATGGRLPDNIDSPIGKTRYHEYVADQYREAARQLAAQGTVLAPHQLQAITWLHQLTANQAVTALQAADPANTENARAKGRTTMLRNAWAKWVKYAAAEDLPLIHGTTSLAQVASDWDLMVNDTLAGIELAGFNPRELRDHRGRWMRAGTVDPYVTGKQYLARLDENERNADISDVEFDRLLNKSKRGRLLTSIVANAVFAGRNTSTSETIGGTGQVWKPERARLHNQLVDEAMSRAASVPAEGKAILGGGLPGAGKTTALKQLPGVDVSKYMTVAPDDFKEELAKRGMIPHIHGLTPMEASPLVADETLHIASLLYERARAARKNMIIDLTMMPSEHTEERVASLHAAGYKVRGVYVDVPIATSIKRAQSRYDAGAAAWLKGQGLGGRYVPPADIQNVWGTTDPDVSQNETYFEHIKSFVDEWQKMDNSVAGRKPQLISSSTRAAA